MTPWRYTKEEWAEKLVLGTFLLSLSFAAVALGLFLLRLTFGRQSQ